MLGVRLDDAGSLALYFEAESVPEEPWRLTSSVDQAPRASTAINSGTAEFWHSAT